jgi:hypothetical protein
LTVFISDLTPKGKNMAQLLVVTKFSDNSNSGHHVTTTVINFTHTAYANTAYNNLIEQYPPENNNFGWSLAVTKLY